MFVSEVLICLGSGPRNAPKRLRGNRGRLRERADLRGRFREGWAAGSGYKWFQSLTVGRRLSAGRLLGNLLDYKVAIDERAVIPKEPVGLVGMRAQMRSQ